MTSLRQRRLVLLAGAGLVFVVLAILTIAPRSSTPVDAEEMVRLAFRKNPDLAYVAQVRSTCEGADGPIEAHATVYHRAGQERISHGQGNGASWSIVGEGYSCTYTPQQDCTLVTTTGGNLSETDRLDVLLENYVALPGRQEKIAGQKTISILLKPKTSGRPHKRLWVDPRHGVVLKSVSYSADGSERGVMETTSIRYNADVDPALLQLPDEGNIVKISRPLSTEASANLGIAPREPDYLPQGFRLDGVYDFECQCNCNHKAIQMVYTDGLNTLSIFQTANAHTCCTDTCHVTGSGCVMQTASIGKIGNVAADDRNVVVVADLPASEIQKIAESYR